MSQPEAVVSIDKNGAITEFNSEAVILFGYPAEQVLGEQLAELLIPAQFREVHNHGLQRFLQSGRGVLLDTENPISLVLMKADGTEFPVNFLMTAVVEGGQTIYRSRVQHA